MNYVYQPDDGRCLNNKRGLSRLLSAESNHRITNNLVLLDSYIRLKSAGVARWPAEVAREDVMLLMKSISCQVYVLACQHRSLISAEQDALADIGKHFHEILMPFRSYFSGIQIIEDFQADCIIQPEQISPVSQILVEVVMNAVKNVRPDAKGIIHVRCCSDAQRAVILEVKDNGPGLPQAFNPKTDGGVGFRILRGLSDQLGATMQFDSDESGLRVRLMVPLTKYER